MFTKSDSFCYVDALKIDEKIDDLIDEKASKFRSMKISMF